MKLPVKLRTLKQGLTVTLVLTAASCGHNQVTTKPLIAGGNVGTASEASYTVRLDKGGDVECSATLYKHDMLLTAAHCFDGRGVFSFSVRGGIQGDVKFPSIKAIGIHAFYRVYGERHYDIAIVQLNQPVNPKFYQPIPLAAPNSRLLRNRMIKVSGYGKASTNQRQAQGILKFGHMVMDAELGDENRIKMTSATGESICGGDSGGPGVFQGKLYGINVTVDANQPCRSWGKLTDIRQYHQWIYCTEQSLRYGASNAANCPTTIIRY